MIFRCGNRGKPQMISKSIPRANTRDKERSAKPVRSYLEVRENMRRRIGWPE